MMTCRRYTLPRSNFTQTGYSFGYAFVDFASEIDAQNAIKSVNGITVRNKRIKVSSYSVFIASIPNILILFYFPI